MPHQIIKNIADKMRKGNRLKHLVEKLYEDFGIIPVIGADIEFYIMDNPLESQDPRDALALSMMTIKPEKGRNQFEIDIFPQENIHKTIEAIAVAKSYLSSLPNVSLHPKPYANDYGSAMHFHINFIDSNGDNFFDHKHNLEHAAKSLCHFLPEHFLIFAPKVDHYTRFDKNFMAPTHICFGGNNRSVAIRTPDVKPRRLEHRVSSPETDEYLAIYAILYAIYHGLKEPQSIRDYQKIHGNAHDAQYDLELLPRSLEEAVELFSA